MELKTHTSKVLRRPRKNILTLSADAQTAVRQVQKYDQLYDSFAPTKRLLSFQSASYLFVIMSHSDELLTLEGEMVGDFNTLVPNGIRFVAYDELMENFQRGVPKELVFLSAVPSKQDDHDTSTLSLAGKSYFGRFHRIVRRRDFDGKSGLKPYPGAATLDSRPTTMADVFRMSRGRPGRFKPDAVGAVYGADSVNVAMSEMTHHMRQVFGPAMKEKTRLKLGVEHQVFQFEGKLLEVECDGPIAEMMSDFDYSASARFANDALMAGVDGVLYQSKRASGRILVAYNESAV